MKTVPYSLVPANMPLLKVEGKYVAQVHVHGSLGFDEMADRIVAQGSTATKPDILAVFESLAVALQSAMLDGCRVNFGGVFDLFPSVWGTFDNATAPFDPAVNGVDVRAQAGSRIRKYVRANAVPERIHVELPAPVPLDFLDFSSLTNNDRITPGNIGTLTGMNLKFNPEAEDEGIFLIPLSPGDTVQVQHTSHNFPGELSFLVPTLMQGVDYWLEVRARIKGGDELRAGRLKNALVAAQLP